MKKRAKFNLSNFHNCTLKMGQLYPVHLQEVLPGDSIQQSTSVFLRFAPMVAPVMHPVYMFAHTFFCSSRVLGNLVNWDFESFITGGDDGNDVQTIPQLVLNATNSPVGSLADAFGLPMQSLASGNTFSVNMLPFLMYYLIWNEYYRDQDLQTEVSFEDWISGYTPSSLSLLAPCWSKDYFTTARPWPQKGPEVTIPVNLTSGGSPLISAQTTISGNGTPQVKFVGGNGLAQTLAKQSDSTNVFYNDESTGSPSGMGRMQWIDPKLSAQTDITWNGGPDTTGNITVNDLREGFAIQRFEEHRALWGSRYEDLLRYLGVRPLDARLQLPEYLGGFSSPVQFSEVLQTSAGETGGVGDLYGHGISAARGRRIRRFIPEHGYIMTLLCVRPISVYAQGIERLWKKSTKYDFWTKELEHIGQQEVLNSEVFADGSTEDGNTFGFQNRYDEYRRGVSVVTGEFRTNQDFWTLARIFANRPALNSDFVECTPSDRIFQVGEQNSDQLYAMVKNNVIAKRLVSKNGNPI
ncbi:major capsid protein [Chicken microvirus mg8_95]|nr:major capsid protein [Chicken microvirus mg8_95]